MSAESTADGKDNDAQNNKVNLSALLRRCQGVMDYWMCWE